MMVPPEMISGNYICEVECARNLYLGQCGVSELCRVYVCQEVEVEVLSVKRTPCSRTAALPAPYQVNQEVRHLSRRLMVKQMCAGQRDGERAATAPATVASAGDRRQRRATVAATRRRAVATAPTTLGDCRQRGRWSWMFCSVEQCARWSMCPTFGRKEALRI